MESSRRLRVRWVDKLLFLSPRDRLLLFESALLLAAVRLGLWLLPFRTLYRLLGIVKPECTKSNAPARPSSERIVWAVTVASRCVPRATCLTQAMATQLWLARRGYQATLHIGVARSQGGRLEGHAWVESEGKVVIGGLVLEHYAVLVSLRD
jgi:hypothetical protein